MEELRSKHGPDVWAQNNQSEGYLRKTSTHIKPPMIDEKMERENNGRMDCFREAAKGVVSQVQRSPLQHCWEFEQDEEVSEVQVAFYDVPDCFRVAKFEPETIAKILQKRRKKFKKTDFRGRVWSRVKENFRFDSTIRRISIFPIIFLTGYYTIQISYQLDLPMLCPSDLLDITNPRGLTELDKIECGLHTEASFKQLALHGRRTRKPLWPQHRARHRALEHLGDQHLALFCHNSTTEPKSPSPVC